MVLCLNSMISVQLQGMSHFTHCCSYCPVNVDGEIIVLPDMLSGLITSRISHKNLLIKTIQPLLFVSVTLCCIT